QKPGQPSPNGLLERADHPRTQLFGERGSFTARRAARRTTKANALPRGDAELGRLLRRPQHAIAVGNRRAQMKLRRRRNPFHAIDPDFHLTFAAPSASTTHTGPDTVS